jgi:hypothetical protein
LTRTDANAVTTTITLRCEQQNFPPYDSLHGTPHAMLLRRVRIETDKGNATFEQTDYGHPGRLNPWDPRGVDSRLQATTAQLKALAEAAGALLD